MLCAVVPAYPKTAYSTIRCLLNTDEGGSPVYVRGVYEDTSQVPHDIRTYPRFEAVQGDLSDSATLDLSGADAALFSIDTESPEGCDIAQWTGDMLKSARLAVEKADSVKRVVLLYCTAASSIIDHVAEKILEKVVSEIVFVQYDPLMEGWDSVLGNVWSEQPFLAVSTSTPLDRKVPMVASDDVGQACTVQLLRKSMPNNPYTLEVHGPKWYTFRDVLRATQEVSNRKIEARFVEEDLPTQCSGNTVTGKFMERHLSVPGNRATYEGQIELFEIIQRLYKNSRLEMPRRRFQIPMLYGVTRNIHLFDGSGNYLGGGYQNPTPHITKELYYEMCEEFLTFRPNNTQWYLHDLRDDNSFGQQIPRDRTSISSGRYVVLGPGSGIIQIGVIEERPVRRRRTPGQSTSHMRENQKHFRDSIRSRDGVCTISGIGGLSSDRYFNLTAAHIFPVSQLASWNSQGYSQNITDTTAPGLTQPSGIFSAQNGLLLRSSIHAMFDDFMLSINPDRGYQVTCFVEDLEQCGGKTLSPSTRPAGNPNSRVSDELLRWHFRQCVLTNMKGAGEKRWDLDPAGGDLMDMILTQENAPEIMSIELGNRFGPYAEC